MKVVGQKSVASTIKMLLTGSWYVGVFLLGVLVIASIYIGLFTEDSVPDVIESNLVVQSMGLEIEFSSEIVEPITKLTFMFTILSIAPLLVLIVLIIYQLRKIFETLVNENPFVEDNAKRLKNIGIFVILTSIVQTILQSYVGKNLVQAIRSPHVQIRTMIEFDMVVIFLGVIFIVLAEVFKIGAKMKEEQDLTV
jgi:hypothetical protein